MCQDGPTGLWKVCCHERLPEHMGNHTSARTAGHTVRASPAGLAARIHLRAGPPPSLGTSEGARLQPDLTVLSSEAVDSPRAVRNMLGSSLYVWLQLRERCGRGHGYCRSRGPWGAQDGSVPTASPGASTLTEPLPGTEPRGLVAAERRAAPAPTVVRGRLPAHSHGFWSGVLACRRPVLCDPEQWGCDEDRPHLVNAALFPGYQE